MSKKQTTVHWNSPLKLSITVIVSKCDSNLIFVLSLKNRPFKLDVSRFSKKFQIILLFLVEFNSEK